MIGLQEAYALPTVWPMCPCGTNNLRQVVGYDFYHLWKKYDVRSMWGNIHPQWRLLQQHLEIKGLGGICSLREKSGFYNRSNWPGDDLNHELRTDRDPIAWRAWSTAQNQLWQLRQPAPPQSFLVNKECLLTCMSKFERKNKSYLLNSPVVSKMYL